MKTSTPDRCRLSRHVAQRDSRELGGGDRVSISGRRQVAFHSFELRSLPAWLDEIFGRFSSSLPPPSFARGRFATFFMTAGAAERGARTGA